MFLVRALVVGWWHSSAALMSECVGSWGPAPASLLWSRVRGATGGASPPRPPRDRPVISTHGYHRPRTTSTRRTPWTWPKRPTRGREVFWLCVGLQRHPQPASKRASAARLPARGGGARSAPAIALPPPERGGKRAVRRHACACVERIFGTKAEPQRIVATRPLCRVQHPVPHSSRLQGIHRVGPVTCDRVRLRPKLSVLAAERPTR